MVKIPYVRNFKGREERELERDERDERGGRDERDRGWKLPLFFSYRPRHAGAQGVALEHGRVPDSSFR